MRELEDYLTTRRRTLETVAGLGQQQIDFAPVRDRWSVGEVLDHLTRVDRIFREEFAELVRRGRDCTPVFLFRTLSDFQFSLPLVPDELLFLFDLPVAFLTAALPRPVRQVIARNRAVPTRSPAILRPRKGRAVDDLRRELREMAEFVEALVADNSEVRLRQLYYYNPLTALTSFPGLLSFTASHESRHQEQLRELLESPGFPTA